MEDNIAVRGRGSGTPGGGCAEEEDRDQINQMWFKQLWLTML